MHTAGNQYKMAFEEYLRRGVPIEISLKKFGASAYYIWRTKRDGKVRPSHAANNGKVFSWDNPPQTGHPGEAFGCRCFAEPYQPSAIESLELLLNDVNDAGSGWSNEDFLNHYQNGNGRSVTVRETGHLVRIVNKYMSLVADDLKAQIADKARKNTAASFNYPFGRVYDMQSEVFSLGDTTIGGLFYGVAKKNGLMIKIEGNLNFFIRDEFADPIDIGIELPGSKIYSITDKWTGTLNGQVLVDRSRSIYRWDK